MRSFGSGSGAPWEQGIRPHGRLVALPLEEGKGSVLLAFHKPFGVISRFTEDASGRPTLAGFGFPPRVYPVGRLDADSEGLLLLSDEARVTRELLNPGRGHPRTYWVQVERVPDEKALARLAGGVVIGGRRTRPCRARRIEPPAALPSRTPPVRRRKTVADSWLELVLWEGRNRQVRRMTAAVGHPTLRLVRAGIGRLPLGDLAPGAFRRLNAAERALVFAR
ncbi:MAG TPA: pseudouridine synthase [Deltaproteobacteria bacterium]|jgi:23S rRNA pseudouridine2457 synthase|nr:pseudouridine synthase [Deltaproteobacteria bacterium]